MCGRWLRSNIEWPDIFISATLHHNTMYTRCSVTRLHGISETRHASFPNSHQLFITNYTPQGLSLKSDSHSPAPDQSSSCVTWSSLNYRKTNHYNTAWKRLPVSEIEAVLPGINYWRCGEICFLYLRCNNIYFTLVCLFPWASAASKRCTST
jgi:hypothetical protein